MIANLQEFYLTPEEYFIWEDQQEFKHEYIDGRVFAMTGGTLPHNEVTLNLYAFLRNHPNLKNCKTFVADAKLGVSEKGPFFYPDLAVTCDSRDQKARRFIQYPCLIAEALSPSTEALDRGAKFMQYRKIGTLREYLLIDPTQIAVELFRLNAQGKWELTTYTTGAEIYLESLGVGVAIDLLYENIEIESP
jgi:Uma2 family endonuclease